MGAGVQIILVQNSSPVRKYVLLFIVQTCVQNFRPEAMKGLQSEVLINLYFRVNYLPILCTKSKIFFFPLWRSVLQWYFANPHLALWNTIIFTISLFPFDYEKRIAQINAHTSFPETFFSIYLLASFLRSTYNIGSYVRLN